MGEKQLNACLDSGANITALRSDALPAGYSGDSTGKVKLTGASGHIVPADLMCVPLGLAEEGSGMTQQIVMLCAVTDELTNDVGALLTPAAVEKLTQLRRELEEDARKTDEMCSDIEKQREGFVEAQNK